MTTQTQAEDRFVDIENKRGRITCRIVNVFTDLSGIDFDWVGLQSLLCVERIAAARENPTSKQIIILVHFRPQRVNLR